MTTVMILSMTGYSYGVVASPVGFVIDILRVWFADKTYRWRKYYDFADEIHNRKYNRNQDDCIFQVKLVFIAIVVITMFTYSAVYVIPVYAQNGGLRIAPVIKWTDNKEGHFNYCVYKGNVTLGANINNLKKYWLVSTENPSFNNTYAYLNEVWIGIT